MAVRTLVVDDHNLMRDGFRALLSRIEGVTVVGFARCGAEAVALVEELKPDLVTMDISMPDMDGIQATERILSCTTGVRVLMVSVEASRQSVDDALKAGASGYMLKDHAVEELADAIEVVTAGRIYLSPHIAQTVLQAEADRVDRSETAVSNVLTPAEREVLRLLAAGHSIRQAADALAIPVKSVEAHRAGIMQKLSLDSVTDLVKYAIREGLVSL